MKRIFTFVIAILSIVFLLDSCGSKKMIKQSYYDYAGQGNTGPRTVSIIEEEIDRCEQEALDEPADEYRSYGSGIDEDDFFARQIAVFNAEVGLVNGLQAEIIATIQSYKEQKHQGGTVANQADIVARAAERAKATVSNCRIICSKKYRISDGTYKCTVCISMPAVKVDQSIKAQMIEEVELAGEVFDEGAYVKARENKKEDFYTIRNKHR